MPIPDACRRALLLLLCVALGFTVGIALVLVMPERGGFLGLVIALTAGAGLGAYVAER